MIWKGTNGLDCLSRPRPSTSLHLSSGVVVVRSRLGSCWWRWHTFHQLLPPTIQATLPLLLAATFVVERVNHGLASPALHRTGREHDDAGVWAELNHCRHPGAPSTGKKGVLEITTAIWKKKRYLNFSKLCNEYKVAKSK